MHTNEISLRNKILNNLHWGEAFFILVTLIGASLWLMNQTPDIVMIGGSGLAIVYFLYSYQRPSTPTATEGEKFGFPELLSSVLIPKVMWLGTAVTVIGILFMLLNFQGHQEMRMVGTTSVGGGLITLAALTLTGASISNSTKQALIRIVPIFLASVYLLIV